MQYCMNSTIFCTVPVDKTFFFATRDDRFSFCSLVSPRDTHCTVRSYVGRLHKTFLHFYPSTSRDDRSPVTRTVL